MLWIFPDITAQAVMVKPLAPDQHETNHDDTMPTIFMINPSVSSISSTSSGDFMRIFPLKMSKTADIPLDEPEIDDLI